MASTGVIGVQIPIDKIRTGIGKIAPSLGKGREDALKAARAIMTTDTVSKEACVELTFSDGSHAVIGGCCKGSGMIHPNMCTMLCFLTTDARISKEMLQKALSSVIPDTFNMVSVDGDTSTNDTCLLLASGTVDFIVTGCSSGQGMMLACNSLPAVLCGYTPTPQDAFLFGRINGGNAASLPLGLNFGWLGEINLQCTLDKLLEGDFGCGFPPEEAARKKHDTEMLKELNLLTKKTLPEVIGRYNKELVRKALQWESVRDDILKNGRDREIVSLIMNVS